MDTGKKSGNWTLEDNKVREKGMIPDQNQTQSLLIQVPPGPIDCNPTHQDVTLTDHTKGGSAGQVTFLPDNVTNLQPNGKAEDHSQEAQKSPRFWLHSITIGLQSGYVP